MWAIIGETLLDSVKMLPFLLVAYLMIEFISRGNGEKLHRLITGRGILGPLGGSVLGLIPQCGFSVVASNLYSERLISIGTLMAIFLATSDEAIPVFLANPGSGKLILQLLAIKTVLAVAAGILIDTGARRIGRDRPFGERMFSEADSAGACNHEGSHNHCNDTIFLAAMRHTFKVFVFILIVLFILNAGLALLGQATVEGLLMKDSFFQPFITGLFGMIPSCASSVVISQLYLEGSLSLGAVLAGLSTGTGVGLVILFRVNRNKKESLLIAAGLYGIGVLAGVLVGWLS